MPAAYLALYESGELVARAERARERLASCVLCPRECRVDRLRRERGICGVGPAAEVASACPHFGEEAPLVGAGGSGTIFFSSCNLRCVFCQNYDISQQSRGVPMAPTTLAAVMLGLQPYV